MRWSINRVLRYGAALLGAVGTDGPTPEDAVIGEGGSAPERPPAPTGTSEPNAERQWPWLVVAGGLLLLLGISTIVYAPFLPVPRDLAGSVGVPILGSSPAVALGFGAVAIAAAAGVVARMDWGRALATVVVLVKLAWSAWDTIDRTGSGAAPDRVAGAIVGSMWVDVVLAAIALFVLVRRWPAGPNRGRSRA